MKNRKKTEEYLLKALKKVGSDTTHDIVKNMFSKMKDKEFDKLMNDLYNKKERLSFIVPHTESDKYDAHKLIKIIESEGGKVVHNLRVKSSIHGEYVTPIEFLVLTIPIKKAAQLLSKKISIPKGNSTSALTGQVANKAKSSSLSMPELQILNGFSLDKTINELFYVRGGDVGANNALNQLLFRNGRASLSEAKEYKTGTGSLITLKMFFNAAHIKSTI